MPYIPENDRPTAINYPMTAGELNYALTEVVLGYLNRKELSYQTINDIVGALEGAKAEFQRRVVSNYEDEARNRNGDVY